MKRFGKMIGMMAIETATGIALLYAMLAITGWMYYQDIIRWIETYRTVTDVCGVGIVIVWAAVILVTIYETVRRCVYEVGTEEI